jgi:protein-glutamine gamma-glutamyltransferase
VTYLASSVLDGLVHLLLLLLLYRLFTLTTLRETRDVEFLCFFMLVAASPGTFGVGFLGVLLGFVVIGTWMLLARHVLESSAARPGVAGAGAVTGRHVFTLSASAAAATIVVTATLFFVIPRMGQAAMPLRARLGRMVSGFSDRVSLGAFGDIETDSDVVMRVHIRFGPTAPEHIPGLRWRGIALDRFDGQTWTRDDSERVHLRRGPGGAFTVARHRGSGFLVTQEIFLEPIGSDVIFGAPRVVGVTLRSDVATADDGDSIMVPSASARLQYVVHSEIDLVPGRPARRAADALTAEARARYLQLPPLPPRVRELAREVAGDGTNPRDAAQRLSEHLSRSYRYTMTLTRQTTLSPVEEFLFVSRAGNCEYFAASLAVMLRSLGIPARVVNGFQRGEWNPYGEYFMVRYLDAHSWVEAYLPAAGWTTFDPSPRGGADTAVSRAPMLLYLDALRMRWYRYVVSWGLEDQVAAAARMRRRAASMWAPPLGWLRHPASVPSPVVLTAVAAVLLIGLSLIRHGRLHRPLARPAHDVPRFYARALRILAGRGLRPAAGETAREFSTRVGSMTPRYAESLATLTTGYERARFGDASLTPAELQQIDRCLALLTARPSR